MFTKALMPVFMSSPSGEHYLLLISDVEERKRTLPVYSF